MPANYRPRKTYQAGLTNPQKVRDMAPLVYIEIISFRSFSERNPH